MFKLRSDFKPTGDQPQAIKKLVFGVKNGLKNQVLLGVTGSGKTFTMANVIENLQIPTLIISHNKTLAGQLYQEFRQFFPDNGVSYFVSYYDYYQPEAYIPQTDTYIEKEAQINELIDKLRLQTTTNILTRNDVIVVASVSCLYNIGSPREYGNFILDLKINQTFDYQKISYRLAQLQYEKSEFDFKRGSFRIRGNYLDIYPAYEDFGYRVYFDSQITTIKKFDPLTGKEDNLNYKSLIIYPAKHYLTSPNIFKKVELKIREDLKKEVEELKKMGKNLEAERLTRRVNHDLEMIKEVGYVNGIENYSRYFDGRQPGEPPYTLIDYFQEAYGNNFLVFIDESHITVPQLRGMYAGDYSRKKVLIDFGFRLKAAFDNRPLTFDEFYQKLSYIIYVSATPDEWELIQTKKQFINQQKKLALKNYFGLAEQLIRPTGIPDPEVILRPAKDEVPDLIKEIETAVKKNNKVLITTLTKIIAEDLTEYLREKKIRAEYLHSDIETLARSDILENLRKGRYDVLIGINLLREGLDLPEVSLVAILDGDKEGFLRSKTALIQTMGRAARNVQGKVIIYADEITLAIKEAVKEIERRRKFQLAYNKSHQIIPQTVYKPIREKIIEKEEDSFLFYDKKKTDKIDNFLNKINKESLTPYDKKKLIKKLAQEMKKQAENLNFEMAIKIREKIKEIKSY
ncbi:MAG: excinuclease ABC subunit UvrB [Patescibacteria group bacterium]|nr:excinuclease ABC subunit UvrB [Patescibacteria group bacterium]